MEIITLRKKGTTDFAKERNRLLSRSKSDWVLFLDRDEEVVGDQCSVVGDYGAFYLKRKNFFLGSYVGTDKLIRLVKKGSGRWIRRVHEVYQPAEHIKVGVLRKPVIVHTTAQNLHDYLAKINHYSTLHALANKEEGKKPTLLKIFFYPQFKFLAELFKSRHVVFSFMQALHSFLSWSKLYFLHS